MIMLALKRCPGGIHNKGAQSEKDQERLRPPDVGPHRLPERTARHGRFDDIHPPSAPINTVILSEVEGSRDITGDFATGFLGFARNDSRYFRRISFIFRLLPQPETLLFPRLP